jgi:4-hydroxy-3-polyprenylbenzoate decarboxylase/2,5-furandicarboxylate decarboxylase 2
MAIVTEMGGIIAPPVPSFYQHPVNIEDIVNQTVGRTLDSLGIDAPNLVQRWEGLNKGSIAE